MLTAKTTPSMQSWQQLFGYVLFTACCPVFIEYVKLSAEIKKKKKKEARCLTPYLFSSGKTIMVPRKTRTMTSPTNYQQLN